MSHESTKIVVTITKKGDNIQWEGEITEGDNRKCNEIAMDFFPFLNVAIRSHAAFRTKSTKPESNHTESDPIVKH